MGGTCSLDWSDRLKECFRLFFLSRKENDKQKGQLQ